MTNTALEAIASSSGKNHFVTAAAEADIDDSIKRKPIRVSLKNLGPSHRRNFFLLKLCSNALKCFTIMRLWAGLDTSTKAIIYT